MLFALLSHALLGCNDSASNESEAARPGPTPTVFIEVTGRGEVSFNGRLETSTADAVDPASHKPYVVCRAEEDQITISIADPNRGLPNMPVLTISGVNGKTGSVVGQYTTNGLDSFGTKNGQTVKVAMFISQKSVDYLASPSSKDFFNGDPRCRAKVESRTGTFSCDFVESGRTRETVDGAWACQGLFQ